MWSVTIMKPLRSVTQMKICPCSCYLLQKNTSAYSKIFYFWHLRCEKDNQTSGHDWPIHWTSWFVRNYWGAWTDAFKSKSAHETQRPQDLPVPNNLTLITHERIIPLSLKHNSVINSCLYGGKASLIFPKTEAKYTYKGLHIHGLRVRKKMYI